MLKIENKITEFKLLKNDERYLILYNESYFSISKLFYSLLFELKLGNHDRERFSEAHQISPSEYKEISQLISDQVDDIINKAEDKKKYIKFSIKLLSEKSTITISNYFSVLFSKNLFKLLFPFSVISAIATSLLINTKYNNHTVFDVSIFDTFLVYSAILIIMFFHELGHASASKHFGVNPKEIGFGFYIVFPVLFSNVTRIWELNKNQKIVVNLGGVYFQGIINFFILLYLLLNNYDNYFTYLIILITKTNLFVMAYSMFPFIRNDGYWIVSDYFNIVNLNKKSYTYIVELFKSKQRINYSLLIYSIGQYMFVFYLCYKYLPTIPKSISEFTNYVIDKGFLDLVLTNLGLLIKLMFSLLIGVVAISNLIRFFNPIFKQKEANA